MVDGCPDFRQEFYRLRVGISGDRRHQDKIVRRNILQRREDASGDGKQVLCIVIAKRAQHENAIGTTHLVLEAVFPKYSDTPAAVLQD